MKPHSPKRRKPPVRDIFPSEVPEVSSAPPAAADDDDPIPEHIRKMLEAAYT